MAASSHAGLLMGFALPDSGAKTMAIGFRVGTSLVPLIQTSVFYVSYGTTLAKVIDVGSVDVSESNTLTGAEALYPLFEGGGAGVKLGIAKSATTVAASDATSTVALSSEGSSLFLAPTILYDQPVGGFSIGAEASYIYALSSSVPKAILILFAGKFNF